MTAVTATVLPAQFAAIFDSTGKVFYLDCLISDDHSFENEVTEFPAETGSDFSDNIRNKPIEVTLTFLVSNTPIGWIATQRDSVSEPVSDVHGHMMKIFLDRKPVSLISSIGMFQMMALKSLSVPRSAENNRETYYATATFVQFQTVTNARALRTATPMGAPKTTMNKPPTTKAWTSTNVAMVICTAEPQQYEWFDKSCGCYRKGALPPTSSIPRWQLGKGRPLILSQDQWAGKTETVIGTFYPEVTPHTSFPILTQRVVHPSDAVIRALVAKYPSTPKTFRTTDKPSDFIQLMSADLWVETNVAS